MVPGPGEREGQKMAGLLLSHLAPTPGQFLEFFRGDFEVISRDFLGDLGFFR